MKIYKSGRSLTIPCIEWRREAKGERISRTNIPRKWTLMKYTRRALAGGEIHGGSLSHRLDGWGHETEGRRRNHRCHGWNCQQTEKCSFENKVIKTRETKVAEHCLHIWLDIISVFFLDHRFRQAAFVFVFISICLLNISFCCLQHFRNALFCYRSSSKLTTSLYHLVINFCEQLSMWSYFVPLFWETSHTAFMIFFCCLF